MQCAAERWRAAEMGIGVDGSRAEGVLEVVGVGDEHGGFWWGSATNGPV